ncbi:MAG: class I SAM-dependent methyltransferase [Parachlamydiaceae bacterium]
MAIFHLLKRVFFLIFIVRNLVAIEPTGLPVNSNTIADNNKIPPHHLMEMQRRHPDCEFLNQLILNYDVFLKIYTNCSSQFLRGCGSYLFDGQHYDYCEKMYEKQKLLFESAKKCSAVLEIGVYMGHSLFIILLANPGIEITCIDIDSRYANPAIKILEEKFNKKITFIQGNSLDILPSLDKKFDLFHIDGCHNGEIVKMEFFECIKKMRKIEGFFVIDDYDNYPQYIHDLLNTNPIYTVVNVIKPNCSWPNIGIGIHLKNQN